MYLQEILSLFSSIDSLILEGFKDDMYRLYPEAKDDVAFNNAIKIYNSDQNKIRDAVKKKITVNGSVAKAIKDKFPDSTSFISFIDDLSKELAQKAKESIEKQKSQSHQLKLKISDEYRQIRAGKLDTSSTDYWLIPCHTFEEAHAAAFKYTGNLPRLSNEEITNKYRVKVPEPATFYRTNKKPAEFLEKMKKETRFFMTPSWCVTGSKKGQDYFNNYRLETSEDEKPLCYIIISKKYPNVRFCITLKIIDSTYKDGFIYKKVIIGEVRDPWQIGRDNSKKAGVEMMKLAFGEDNVEKILKKVLAIDPEKLSDIINGTSLFFNKKDIIKFDEPLPHLKNGTEMFCHCNQLSSFDVKELPSLEDGGSMFQRTGFNSFNTHMPKLKIAHSMFHHCVQLNSFIANTPSLKNGEGMFYDCKKLSTFKRRFVIIRKWMEYVCWMQINTRIY